MIPHNRPTLLPEDRAAADAVLASGWITQGPAVAALEAWFVEQYDGGQGCAVSSGTAALFLAIHALGGGRDTVIAVPTYACSALLNAIIMAGAKPRVVDVLHDTFCVDPQAVAAGIADMVIAVHTFGATADVKALQAGGRIVIEDCCQSLGGLADDVPLGATGATAVFSFYATKIVTGGQGGLIWSKSAAAISRVRDYREFDGRDNYVPRFNLQMTDLQAALVMSQLTRLAAIREFRARVAREYSAALPRGLGLQVGVTAPGRMVYRFVIIAPDLETREALRAHMKAADIGCIVPVERFELLHRYLDLDPQAFPVAEKLADVTLSLPIHLQLADADIARVSQALNRFRP